MKQVNGVWLPKDDAHFENGYMHENGDYQRDTFQAAMLHIQTPKIFYDIGAHVGLWSRMAHNTGFKEIHAYEPNPKTFECLVRNLEVLDNHIYMYKQAVGIVEKELYIHEDDVNNSGAISLGEIANGESILVKPITAIKICRGTNILGLKQHETLVKIDTEGMEADCVRGMISILYALRPVVCVEQRTNEDAITLLQQMGMKLVEKVRRDFILIWPV